MVQLRQELADAPRSGGTTHVSLGYWQRLQVVVRRSLGPDSPFNDAIRLCMREWSDNRDSYSPGFALQTIDSILFELELAREDSTEAKDAQQGPPDPEYVFVVHGRDVGVRDDMFGFLRSIGLSPLEWETAIGLTGEASPYIGDILVAAFSRAQAVVVLLTPDEVARLRPELVTDEGDPDAEEGYQARPNVLFEAGMAMALHEDRTVLVTVGTTRPFSDIGGRMAVALTGDAASRNALASRLRNAGCAVDTTGTDWLTKGRFMPAGTAD